MSYAWKKAHYVVTGSVFHMIVKLISVLTLALLTELRDTVESPCLKGNMKSTIG